MQFSGPSMCSGEKDKKYKDLVSANCLAETARFYIFLIGTMIIEFLHVGKIFLDYHYFLSWIFKPPPP